MTIQIVRQLQIDWDAIEHAMEMGCVWHFPSGKIRQQGPTQYRQAGFIYREVLLADPCVYCGRKATGLDHIVPRISRGVNGWQNRAPACIDCDMRKSSNTLLAHLVRPFKKRSKCKSCKRVCESQKESIHAK